MNERRRTLLFSGGYKIPTDNGVYIESVDHKFYLPDDWDTASTANSIAVVTDECKFRISLHGAPTAKEINNSYKAPWENYLTGTDISDTAEEDYNGAYNTQQIMTLQPSSGYAAGWCNAYIFPDGETKGYLPALGELCLAGKNKTEINTALTKCGEEAIVETLYWSSTFYGVSSYYRSFWYIDWRGSARLCYGSAMTNNRAVRPFAVLEDSN